MLSKFNTIDSSNGPGFLEGCCGNHPENHLAKFGYILDMKVGKKKKGILLCSWLYLLQLIWAI
jgi:hypothetical protein